MSTQPETRSWASRLFGHVGQFRSGWTDEQVLKWLTDFNSSKREQAGLVLAYRDDKLKFETVEAVRMLRKDVRPWVRQAAFHTLYLIEKRKYELLSEGVKK